MLCTCDEIIHIDWILNATNTFVSLELPIHIYKEQYYAHYMGIFGRLVSRLLYLELCSSSASN